MIKNIKGPTDYFGCDKCETDGEWNGKITFLETNAQSRTDVRFDELQNTEHHLGPSAFSYTFSVYRNGVTIPIRLYAPCLFRRDAAITAILAKRSPAHKTMCQKTLAVV